MSFKKIDPKQDFVKQEHDVLRFWDENKIEEKYRNKNKDSKKRWSFLDGPITANNPMGVHHAWGRTLKDLYQRYKNMQGFNQRFQNGFDCQGLWVEVEVEKELGLKTKKDIENLVEGDRFASIEQFVNLCKERVEKYSKIQTEQSIRLGQFMDWENSYYTNSEINNYGIWSFIKKCHKNGYLYKGHDSVPWCPRCGTAISQHEILTEEYKEIVHKTIFLKLSITSKNHEGEGLLIWTTTPWTLPINVAVVADPKKEYILAGVGSEKLWVLKKLAGKVLGNYKEVKTVLGSDLIGLEYKGFFDELEEVKKQLGEYKHRVVASDSLLLPISEAEGTGLVHCAPGAGAEDYALGKKEKLLAISPLNEEGIYKKGYAKYSGLSAAEVSKAVLEDLEKSKQSYKIEDYKHRYPTCWRCKEELVYRLVDEWYIAMDTPSKLKIKNQKSKLKSKTKTLRQKMIAIAKKIKWMPKYGEFRELDWLNNMHDWLISKKRYWGLALPIYECKKCGNIETIGSREELKEKTIEGWEDFEGKTPHKPWVDIIKIKCSKCNELVSRIPDVGNPWLDAGIVPYSTMYYFDDKKKWENWFPADFICESMPGQFKNWFYSLIAMSAVLENTEPYKNILGFETVKDENGEIMHKSKSNAIRFDEAAEKVGSDVMRWMYVDQNPFRDLRFGYHNAQKVLREFVLTLWNSYSFFVTYANLNNWKNPSDKNSENILDKWIIAQLNILIKDSTESLDLYQHNLFSENIKKFVIEDLSTWYIRRNRKRSDADFFNTLFIVLKNTAILLAPVLPFLSESIYQNLKTNNDPESVHLCDWPKVENKNQDEIINNMQETRNIVAAVLSARELAKIKIRQPLNKVLVYKTTLMQEYLDIIKDEVNVLEIEAIEQKDIKKYQKGEYQGSEIYLDIAIDDNLKTLGLVRETIRFIQGQRKNAKLNPGEGIDIKVDSDENIKKVIETNLSEIKENCFIENIEFVDNLSAEESDLDGHKIKVSIIEN